MNPVNSNPSSPVYATSPSRPLAPVSNAHSRSSLQSQEDDCIENSCITLFSIIAYPFVLLFEWINNLFCKTSYDFGDPTAGIIEDVYVDEKAAMDAALGLKINMSLIGRAPPPMTVAELDSVEARAMDIHELLPIFDKTMLDNGTSRLPQTLADRQYLMEYIDFVMNRQVDSERFPGVVRSAMYNENLLLLAQNLVLEMNKPYKDVPLHKRVIAFSEIAEATHNCPPRIYEESQRQLKETRSINDENPAQALREKAMLWLQMLKEDILLRAFQTSQFHVLNRARQLIGREWGLDTNPVNINDPSIEMGGKNTANEFRKALTDHYTPAYLIETIRTRLVEDAKNGLINKYMQQNPPDVDFSLLYEPHGKALNCKGVAWLLKQLNFLN